MFELNGDVELRYFYDAAGAPIAFSMGSDPILYLYRKNLQGDITGVYSGSTGTLLVSYVYDAWGKVTKTDVAETTESAVVFNYNPYLYRGYRYDSETGLYYLNSRYYDPETGRFINADGFVSTGQGILGNNMFAYCENNPVKHIDDSGALFCSFLHYLHATLSEIEAAFIEVAPAYAACGGAAVVDGPLPIGDILGLAGAALITVGAIGYGVYKGSISLSREKEREKEKADIRTKKKTTIYRYGGTNPGNLTPKEKDKKTGLSFSTIPAPGAAMTTIEALNATGIVYAIQDGPTHVSVRPVVGTMEEWINEGPSSKWTQAVRSVVIKWDGIN